MTSLSIKTCCFVGVHHHHHCVSALALNNTFVLLVATVKAAFTLADSIFLSVILCFMLLKKKQDCSHYSSQKTKCFERHQKAHFLPCHIKIRLSLGQILLTLQRR